MTKKIHKRDATASKKSIVQHAITLFSTRGYAGTSMDELSKACGLNKAMIFYYFKNKKGLYEAVMEEILQEIYKATTQKISSSKSAEVQLETFIKTYGSFACSHPYLPALLLKELSDSGAVLPEQLFKSMRKLFALFSDILKRGEDEGVFQKSMPMVLYFMVIGSLNLIVTTKPLRQKAANLDDIALETCSECEIEDISHYVTSNILAILKGA